MQGLENEIQESQRVLFPQQILSLSQAPGHPSAAWVPSRGRCRTWRISIYFPSRKWKHVRNCESAVSNQGPSETCVPSTLKLLWDSSLLSIFSVETCTKNHRHERHDRLPVPIPRVECVHSPCNNSTCQRCLMLCTRQCLQYLQCLPILAAWKAKPRSNPNGNRQVVQQCQNVPKAIPNTRPRKPAMAPFRLLCLFRLSFLLFFFCCFFCGDLLFSFFFFFFFRFFSSYLPICIRVHGIHARIDDVWHEHRISIDWSSLSLHFFIGLNVFLFPWLQQSKRQENCWCMTGGNFSLDCMPQHQHALRSCSIWDFASGMTKRTMICLKNFLRLEFKSWLNS